MRLTGQVSRAQAAPGLVAHAARHKSHTRHLSWSQPSCSVDSASSDSRVTRSACPGARTLVWSIVIGLVDESARDEDVLLDAGLERGNKEVRGLHRAKPRNSGKVSWNKAEWKRQPGQMSSALPSFWLFLRVEPPRSFSGPPDDSTNLLARSCSNR